MSDASGEMTDPVKLLRAIVAAFDHDHPIDDNLMNQARKIIDHINPSPDRKFFDSLTRTTLRIAIDEGIKWMDSGHFRFNTAAIQQHFRDPETGWMPSGAIVSEALKRDLNVVPLRGGSHWFQLPRPLNRDASAEEMAIYDAWVRGMSRKDVPTVETASMSSRTETLIPGKELPDADPVIEKLPLSDQWKECLDPLAGISADREIEAAKRLTRVHPMGWAGDTAPGEMSIIDATILMFQQSGIKGRGLVYLSESEFEKRYGIPDTPPVSHDRSRHFRMGGYVLPGGQVIPLYKDDRFSDVRMMITNGLDSLKKDRITPLIAEVLLTRPEYQGIGLRFLRTEEFLLESQYVAPSPVPDGLIGGYINSTGYQTRNVMATDTVADIESYLDDFMRGQPWKAE